jgi:hypothetical protein
MMRSDSSSTKNLAPQYPNSSWPANSQRMGAVQLYTALPPSSPVLSCQLTLIIHVTVSRVYVYSATMPSSSALWASIGPNVTSPMHLMFGKPVTSWLSMMMRPRKLTSDNDVFEVGVFNVWPAADRSEHNIGLELMDPDYAPAVKGEIWKLRTVSSFTSFAASVVTTTSHPSASPQRRPSCSAQT